MIKLVKVFEMINFDDIAKICLRKMALKEKKTEKKPLNYWKGNAKY
ncbi:MAG: hypothetical protein H5T44_00045 [Thermoplasmatales archaeon]|nr:hypothetical protein [Thermoplasmatales archaeon]